MVGSQRETRPVENVDFTVVGMSLVEIAEYVQDLIKEWGPNAVVEERWHPYDEENYLAVMTTRPETEHELRLRILMQESRDRMLKQRLFTKV